MWDSQQKEASSFGGERPFSAVANKYEYGGSSFFGSSYFEKIRGIYSR